MDLTLAQEELFQGEMVDVWQDKKRNFFMSREQIGTALGYKNPRKAIKDIHGRNKKRMDSFSIIAKVEGGRKSGTPLGGEQETILYNKHGIYEICRKSDKEKADDFFDWVYSVLDALERGELVWQEQRTISKDKRKSLTALIAEYYPLEKAKVIYIQASRLICELITGYKSIGSFKKSIGVTDSRSFPQLLNAEQLEEYNMHQDRIEVFLSTGFDFKELAAVLKGNPITITIETKKKEESK